MKNTIKFFLAKLLVTTGYPHANGIHSEVHDLLHPNMKCNPLNNYPVNVKDATAGLIQLSKPVICGGFHQDLYDYMSCNILGISGNVEVTVDLIHPRTYSASVAISDDILWITGGTVL